MSEQRVVVMGLGNLLWADEGFGVPITTGPSMWRLSMAVLRD